MTAPLGTFTWQGASGGSWATGASWSPQSGSGSFGTSGSQGGGEIFVLPSSASYPVHVSGSSQSVVAGQVTINASAILDIDSSDTLKANSGSYSTYGLGTLTDNGTLNLASGSTVQYLTISVGNGGEIFGQGQIENLAISATSPALTTSGTGKVVADGGQLSIIGLSNTYAVSGSFVIDSGATLSFTNTSTGSSTTQVQSGSTVTFGGAGTLITNSTSSFTSGTYNATISSLTAGTSAGSTAGASVIEIFGLTTAVTATSITGSTINVTFGGTTYHFTTADTTLSGVTVNTAESGSGSTGYTQIWLDTNPCYAAGTHVTTARGQVAVEELVEGDQVVTLEAEGRTLRPVRWIGHRRVNLRQHPQPNLAAPIRIKRHALGQDMPVNDLLLSPDHSLFLDGRLVPAKLLINDMTITQERDTPSVTYYHVELDRHSVMLAEGAPAESYLDTGNRAMFANAGLALVLHPEFAVNANLQCWETDACAPLAVDQASVRPLWEGLAERAEALGFAPPHYTTTSDPDLHLLADGRRIAPLSRADNRYVFTVPAGVASLRLASRASVPSYFEAYVDDWRQLGVAVRRILVRDSGSLVEIPPDHPGLTQGWHGVEHDGVTMWRWMNGNAVLPIERTSGPTMVEVQVGIAMKHKVEQDSQERLAA